MESLIEKLERIAQANFDAGRTGDAAIIREVIGVLYDVKTIKNEDSIFRY